MYIYSKILPEISGLQVRAGTYGTVRTLPGNSAPVYKTYPKNSIIGKSTGRLGMVEGGQYIYVETSTDGGNHWIEYRNVIYPAGFSQSFNISQIALRAFDKQQLNDKQKEYNDLLAYQARIFFELLAAAKILQVAQQSGKDVTAVYSLYKQLTNNYNARQIWIATNSSHLTEVSQTKLGVFKSFVFTLATGNTLGAVPLIPLAIAFAVGVVATTVAVLSLTGKKEEAKVDFEKLPTLQKLLTNVDPTTANEVRKEVQKVADDSFKQGRGGGFFANIGKAGTGIALGIGAYLVYNFVTKNK